jgi:HEAT repeat protein
MQFREILVYPLVNGEIHILAGKYQDRSATVVQSKHMDTLQDRIPELIRDLSLMNENTRWAAASALAGIGTIAVEPLMTTAMDHQDSVVRLRAAWALGQIGDECAIGTLIHRLLDGTGSVRMRAADALGNLRAYQATDALLLLLSDRNTDVRRHAIAALAKIADPGSADRIGDTLKDADWRVRIGAALALVAIGNEKSLGYLNIASCDENECIRMLVLPVSKTGDGKSSRNVSDAGV